MNDDVWWSISQHADKNQTIYQNVFGIYPDNNIRSFKDIGKIKNKAEITKYEDFKDLIKGNAVKFQTKFLKEENL